MLYPLQADKTWLSDPSWTNDLNPGCSPVSTRPAVLWKILHCFPQSGENRASREDFKKRGFSVQHALV